MLTYTSAVLQLVEFEAHDKTGAFVGSIKHESTAKLKLSG
jgi:hypothetical protein